MPTTIEELIADPSWKSRVAEARQAGHSYADIESSLRQRGVLESGTSTTTTPTTRTFPQALGETAAATLTRPIYAGQDYLAQGLLPHSMGAVGSLANTFLPFLAPEMTVGGAAMETMQRMQPGTTEPQAEQAASQGQLAGGIGKLVGDLPFAIKGGMEAYRAARTAKAGPVDLGGGIAQAGAREGLKRLRSGRGLGGTQDASTFAETARPFLREHLRALEAGGPPEAVAALRELVGSESLKPLVRAVREDPAMVASFLERTPELKPALQQAHMTELVNGATRQVGTQKGLLNVKRLIGPWNKLGDAEKAAIYGLEQAKKIDKLFANMATLVPSGAAGATAPVGAHLGKLVMAALEGGGIVEGAHLMMQGKPVKAAAVAVAPFIAKLLIKNGGPDWLDAVVTASKDPRVWAQAAPQLGKIGAQLLSQPDDRSALR